MRDAGLEQAIKAAGGVASLARAIGVAQPSVSAWSRIPAERVLAVETLTRVHRYVLRPDLYGPSEDQVTTKPELPAQSLRLGDEPISLVEASSDTETGARLEPARAAEPQPVSAAPQQPVRRHGSAKPID